MGEEAADEQEKKDFFEWIHEVPDRGIDLDGDKLDMKEGKHFLGENDGKGWIWLTAGQTPGGVYLYLTKSPPYGERPLALIRENNIDEFFAKVDWHRLFVRLHKWNLWGGRVTDFPYPIRGKLAFR